MRSGRGDAAGMRPTREEEAGNGFHRQRAPVTTTSEATAGLGVEQALRPEAASAGWSTVSGSVRGS